MTALLISIDRSGISATMAPLVLSGTEDSHPLGITNYTDPARQVRLTYLPDARDVHGSKAIAAAWQQSLLSFDVTTDQAADEAASRALVNELRDAISQFSFTVTTTVGNAPAQTWQADMGSLLPVGPRTLEDLDSASPEFTVTIPVYPIPS